MNLSCYIIDDEPLAIEVLQSHIEKYEPLNIEGTFQNAVKAFETMQEKPVDLLFLDIQMPGLSGLEFLRTLQNPPQVILTTAYREYAVEGFELDVVDYLLKPISFERFLKAMGKVSRDHRVLTPKKEETLDDSFLVVQEKNKKIRIPLEEILYIESQRDYVKIVTCNETFQPLHKIGDLEEKLSMAGFIRIHRSYLVPVDKIKSWSASEVEVPDFTLPVGRTYKNEMMNILKSPMS